MPPDFHFGPLKRDRKFLMYRYSTMPQADADFYAGYDASFLARKATLLYSMYNDPGSMKAGDYPLDCNEDELRTLLATELHCTVYHQTEALIALLLAEYQNRPDWVYLTSYASSEIKDAAKAIAKRFESIPGTTASNLRQLVEQGVYANLDFSKTEIEAQWVESITSIMALLQIVSEQFVEAHEYNSYKHGLRVVLSSAAFGVAPGDSPQNVRTFSVMPHSMTFLQIEKLGDDYGAHMVTKDVKPEYSVKVVRCMGSLLATIKEFRLARIQGKYPAEVNLPVYDTIHLDQIKPVAKFGCSY